MSHRFLARDYALGIVGLCGALVFGALLLEFSVADMEPCSLCLMQRLWFLIAGALAYAGLAHNPRWGIYPLMTIIAALAGGGFALRQLWLKTLPADQVPACIDLGRLFEFGMFSDAVSAMVYGTGDCVAEAPFLGVPIPLWALAGFAAILVAAVLQWRSG